MKPGSTILGENSSFSSWRHIVSDNINSLSCDFTASGLPPVFHMLPAACSYNPSTICGNHIFTTYIIVNIQS